MRSSLPIVSVDARMAFMSGIGVYFRNIFLNLARRNDIRFQVLGRKKDFEELAYCDGMLFTELRSPIYSVSEQFEVPRSIISGSRCIWTPHYNMPVFAGCRKLVTVHDVAHLAEPTLNRKLIPRLYARSMLAAVKNYADHIFFVSDFSELEFRKVVGNPKGITTLTPNAAAAQWTSFVGPVPRVLKNVEDRPYFIFVGNVKPHKNLGGLLRAMAILDGERMPNLVIVGRRDGFFNSDQELAQLAEKLADRVVFSGELPDAELVELVANAVALIQPSFYEGFGIPPLEAMAVGTPALVSDIPSLRETCGGAALYFNPNHDPSIADAMRRIFLDSDLAQKLRIAGEQRCADFSFVKSADIVYAAILSQIQVS